MKSALCTSDKELEMVFLMCCRLESEQPDMFVPIHEATVGFVLLFLPVP